MAESITIQRSKTHVPPTYASVQKVTLDWTSGTNKVASDTINVAGAIHEVVTIPSTTSVPVGGYDVKLLDVSRSDVDYLNGQVLNRSSDTVQFAEPLVSSVLPVVVAGDVRFRVDAASSDGVAGRVEIFLRT